MRRKSLQPDQADSDRSTANVSYATYHSALVADATTANDATAFARLAVDGSGSNNPITNNSTINVKTANLRAVGINANAPPGNPDGTINLNTHITTPGSPGSTGQFGLLSTTEHEIDEVLGLGSSLPGIPFNDPFTEDLFRFA
jgi:hypothetical protein